MSNEHLLVLWDGNTGKSLYVYHVINGHRNKIASSSVMNRKRSIFDQNYENMAEAKGFTWPKLNKSSSCPGIVWGHLGMIGHEEVEGLPVYLEDNCGKVKELCS